MPAPAWSRQWRRRSSSAVASRERASVSPLQRASRAFFSSRCFPMREKPKVCVSMNPPCARCRAVAVWRQAGCGHEGAKSAKKPIPRGEWAKHMRDPPPAHGSMGNHRTSPDREACSGVFSRRLLAYGWAVGPAGGDILPGRIRRPVVPGAARTQQRVCDGFSPSSVSRETEYQVSAAKGPICQASGYRISSSAKASSVRSWRSRLACAATALGFFIIMSSCRVWTMT